MGNPNRKRTRQTYFHLRQVHIDSYDYRWKVEGRTRLVNSLHNVCIFAHYSYGQSLKKGRSLKSHWMYSSYMKMSQKRNTYNSWLSIFNYLLLNSIYLCMFICPEQEFQNNRRDLLSTVYWDNQIRWFRIWYCQQYTINICC